MSFDSTPAQIRHGRARRLTAGTLVKAVAVAAAVVLVSSVSVTAIAVSRISGQIAANSVDISGGGDEQQAPPVIGAMEGGFNMLLVGTDNDANQGEEFGERDATLNDVNILLHVSEDQRNAVVVSIPRDLLIDQPECTNPDTGDVTGPVFEEAINDAWGRGGQKDGLTCVVNTVEELTGVDIPFAAAISFNGVIEMTNAVGGVPVCLTDDMFDVQTGLDLPAGTNVISGQTALQFLRNRYAVGDGSDIARIASQQQYMSSLMRTLKSAETLANPVKLYGLAQAAASNMSLSTSLGSPDAMVSLALTLKDVDLDKLVFVQYPSAGLEGSGKVVPVTELADELFAKIIADEPFLLDDEALVDGTVSANPGEEPPAPEEPVVPDPSATPGATGVPAPTPTTETLEGVKGQTAAQETCAEPN